MTVDYVKRIFFSIKDCERISVSSCYLALDCSYIGTCFILSSICDLTAAVPVIFYNQDLDDLVWACAVTMW